MSLIIWLLKNPDIADTFKRTVIHTIVKNLPLQDEVMMYDSEPVPDTVQEVYNYVKISPNRIMKAGCLKKLPNDKFDFLTGTPIYKLAVPEFTEYLYLFIALVENIEKLVSEKEEATS